MHGRHRTPAAPNAPGASSRTRWTLLLLLCVAQLMVILDITAVNVALPDLAKDLDIAQGDIGWTITSYSLIFGSLLLLGGRAADLLGRRRVFLTGLGVFTASSLRHRARRRRRRCSSPRAPARASAPRCCPRRRCRSSPTSFHGPERAKALGVWGAVGGAGAAIGVLLGGVLTELVDWRAIFFINLPVGLRRSPPRATHLLPADAARPQWRGLDLRGALLATASLGALVYALSQAQTQRLDLDPDARPRRRGARRPRRLRRARAAHRPAAAARPAPRRPRRRRRLRDDARGLGRAVRLVPALLAVPAERARHRRARDRARVPAVRRRDRRRASTPPATSSPTPASGCRSPPGSRSPPPGCCCSPASAPTAATPPTSCPACSSPASASGSSSSRSRSSVLTGAADHETGMLSGLNTTGHEIGGSLGIAILATIAAGAAGPPRRPAWPTASATPSSSPRSSPAPRARRAGPPPVRPDVPAQARARAARRRPLTR